jgi:hypothetical protein
LEECLLGCLSTLALLATAVAAGLGKLSFWWVLLPAFVAGSFALSNGPHHSSIIEANRRGQLAVFPTMLTISVLSHVALAGVVFWIASFWRH